MFGQSLPARARAGAIGIVYALAIAIFGGTTQLFETLLIRWTGNPVAPGWYMTGAVALALVGALLIPERRSKRRRLVEQLREAALLAVAPGAAVPGVAGEEREDAGRLGEDHLLHRGRDLAPARRFLERRGGAGAVAHVGDGDLHRIFVHLDIVVAEDFRADDSVLREVLGNAAADHQQAGGARLDLDVGQLAEVGDRVEHHVVAAALHRVDLVLDEAEARRAVDEGRAEDRHVMLVGELDEAALLLGVALAQPLAHLADEGAAAE